MLHENNDYLVIRGAREHNLKNIDLKIPRNKLVVITGLSGSGKSSLAFDTIYAEGQRRYVESLSAYARQFLEQLHKPDVEYVGGGWPAISIEQRSAGGSPRSTVGTQTEIYDYLRLLFARIGIPYCYKCNTKISRQSAQEITQRLMALPVESRIIILAPLIKGRKGEYRNLRRDIQKSGFVRVRVDGKLFEAEEEIRLEKFKVHNIEVVVDRLTINPQIKKRLADSVETALKIGRGAILVSREADKPDLVFSEVYACPKCGLSLSEIEPRIFSFNSPYGACPECKGLGTKVEIDPDLLVPDKSKPAIQAIAPWHKGGKGFLLYFRALMRELAGNHNFDMETPFNRLTTGQQKMLLYGSEDMIWGRQFEGAVHYLERMFLQTDSDYLKEEISRFMSVSPCPQCRGSRLKKESLAVRIAEKNIYEVTQLSIKDCRQFLSSLRLDDEKRIISQQILKEIHRRLAFCINVGLDYLTLERKSNTLSGGEAQRIRLATQVGSGLVGVVYILDEPTIGLHQRDNNKLLTTLTALRDLGNTLIIVEHDEATIRNADYIIDLGPGAGKFGGEVIYAGDLPGLLQSERSLTGKYLRKELRIPTPLARRLSPPEKWLTIYGAAEHNLKHINVRIPLGVFVCVTGVSGSGKSTLVDEVLYRALAQKLYRSKEKPGKFRKLEGAQYIDKVIVVDQSPIGRTPRSNPATYTGVFGYIREIFSRIPEAKTRGFKPGRFSFNVKGGRCEACMGDGIKKIAMHFLPDVYVTCEVCKGARFNEPTLEVRFKGYSIAEVLTMSVAEALGLFANVPRIKTILETLNDVGLGYIQLGQSATTLSGGEAQRVKLAAELSKRSTGKTLYILDEPTTGLHFADIDRLLKVLQRLVDKGNTVLVIEHNLEVIKSSDYIIDLGPEGGDAGGEVVACGLPEELIKRGDSHTA
ncbi:MAG: excinuclease ABC subunit UvrA, partial [Candidatus Omnitrophota bacterium]